MCVPCKSHGSSVAWAGYVDADDTWSVACRARYESFPVRCNRAQIPMVTRRSNEDCWRSCGPRSSLRKRTVPSSPTDKANWNLPMPFLSHSGRFSQIFTESKFVLRSWTVLRVASRWHLGWRLTQSAGSDTSSSFLVAEIMIKSLTTSQGSPKLQGFLYVPTLELKSCRVRTLSSWRSYRIFPLPGYSCVHRIKITLWMGLVRFLFGHWCPCGRMINQRKDLDIYRLWSRSPDLFLTTRNEIGLKIEGIVTLSHVKEKVNVLFKNVTHCKRLSLLFSSMIKFC